MLPKDRLPANMSTQTKQALLNAGVQLGDIDPNDPLFLSAQLPDGWRIDSTGGYGLDLRDNQGRTRAGIFYKQTPYERDANMGARSRYCVVVDFKGGKNEFGTFVTAAVVDAGSPLQSTAEHYYSPDDNGSYFTAVDEARNDAVKALDQKFPGWQDPSTYWDEEAS